MDIIINGDEHFDLPDGLVIAELLARFKLPVKKIAVERNLEIVAKSKFAEQVLADGDRLEIIHFIGGG